MTRLEHPHGVLGVCEGDSQVHDPHAARGRLHARRSRVVPDYSVLVGEAGAATAMLVARLAPEGLALSPE